MIAKDSRMLGFFLESERVNVKKTVNYMLVLDLYNIQRTSHYLHPDRTCSFKCNLNSHVSIQPQQLPFKVLVANHTYNFNRCSMCQIPIHCWVNSGNVVYSNLPKVTPKRHIFFTIPEGARTGDLSITSRDQYICLTIAPIRHLKGR